ncbi:outer membrane protein transport protein [candidate division KSB1 bacterium]|nr:outer membrane protein transport protein [candidate division KSB1 bacterium]
MKRVVSISAIVLSLFIASAVFASGVALTGIGARATALGGAYRGVASDWSAMYWNPAGLTQIEGLSAGASFELIKPVGKYLTVAGVPVYKSEEIENESKTFPVPAAGIVYGMGKLAVGLAVYAPFGLGAEWDALNTEAYNSSYPAIDFEDDLQVINIQPTIAYKLSEKLSVGLGVSITWADIIIRKPTTTPNPLLNDPAYAGLKQLLLTPMGLASDTYAHILTEQQLKGDGISYGASFGLTYKVNEKLTVGLSGNYYADVSLDGKLNATTYYAAAPAAVVQQLSQSLDQLIAVNQLTPAQKMQILGVYSGVKQVKYADAKGDAALPLPMTLGAGVAFKPCDKTLLAADVSWTQWSSWDVINIDIEDGSKSELVENWKDGVRISAGVERKITDPLTLRLGYYTEPTAIPDETITITIPDPSRRHAINVGVNYALGIANLYLSYERILIGDRDVSTWVYNTAAQGYDNMAGTYKMSVNNLMMGLGLAF